MSRLSSKIPWSQTVQMCMMGGPKRAVAWKEVRYHLSLPIAYTYPILSFVFIFIATLKLSSNGIANEMRLSFHGIVTQ